MALKKNKITEDDRDLFREAAKGVEPIKHTKISTQPKPVKPPKRQRIESNLETPFAFSDYETLDSVDSDTYLEFAKPGLQHKMLRKLHQGQYNVDAILDLHGKTAEEARETLAKFLQRCRHNSLRHVLIIHGKGRGKSLPVLKNKLNHWLRQTDDVLAFCSTKNNSGALSVLLKR